MTTDAGDPATRGELFSEERSAEVVSASFAGSPDPRLREVLESLVRHLHGFVKEVEPTQEEWSTAIGFLTETGHRRQPVPGLRRRLRCEVEPGP